MSESGAPALRARPRRDPPAPSDRAIKRSPAPPSAKRGDRGTHLAALVVVGPAAVSAISVCPLPFEFAPVRNRPPWIGVGLGNPPRAAEQLVEELGSSRLVRGYWPGRTAPSSTPALHAPESIGLPGRVVCLIPSPPSPTGRETEPVTASSSCRATPRRHTGRPPRPNTESSDPSAGEATAPWARHTDLLLSPPAACPPPASPRVAAPEVCLAAFPTPAATPVPCSRCPSSVPLAPLSPGRLLTWTRSLLLPCPGNPGCLVALQTCPDSWWSHTAWSPAASPAEHSEDTWRLSRAYTDPRCSSPYLALPSLSLAHQTQQRLL